MCQKNIGKVQSRHADLCIGKVQPRHETVEKHTRKKRKSRRSKKGETIPAIKPYTQAPLNKQSTQYAATKQAQQWARNPLLLVQFVHRRPNVPVVPNVRFCKLR